MPDIPSLSILVVDDAAWLRAMLRDCIAMLGYAVIEAGDGAEAVAKFREHRPDMVLMDMVMPNLDGIAATRAIRQACGERWVPIIMISADDDQDRLVHALTQGCDDYLTKPVNLQILAAKIQAFRRVAEMQSEMDRQREELRRYRDYAEEELSLIQHIMTRLVRRGRDDHAQLQVWNDPARGASGDIVLSVQAENGVHYLMLADATGHGLAAAVTLIPVANVFFAMATKGFNVGTIVEEMNQQVRSYCPVERFVALTLVAVKPQSDIIAVWNGGNPPVVVLDAAGSVVRQFRSRLMPLGILGSGMFSPATEFLHYGEDLQLALFSDGLIEAGNGEQYGLDRLLSVLTRVPAAMRFEAVQQDLQRFLGDIDPHDDVSFTLLDCRHESIRQASSDVVQPQRDGVSAERSWHLNAQLSAEQLRQVDLVPMVVDWASKMGLSRERSGDFFVVMTELFINALDHGLLELPSELKQAVDGFERYFELRQERLQQLNTGEIRLFVSQSRVGDRDVIGVRLRDSGKGFLHQNYLTVDADQGAMRSGRGIALVRKLCKHVEYFGEGNEVYAELGV
jgi:DNA-binding response OmpR family regulator/anti-sigma regulatory factor (Ser/Thr protein kinase)